MREIEKTSRLMRFDFSSPKPYKTCVLIIVFSIFFGLIIFQGKSMLMIIGYSILIFILPAIFSGIVSKPLSESLGGVFYLRRSMLLSFLCLLIVGFISVIGFLFNRLSISVVFGYSSIIWLRHLALVGTSNPNHIKSFPGSVLQTVLGFAFSLFIFPSKPFLWIAFTIIFFFSAATVVEIAKTPVKKSFGENALVLLKQALGHLTNGSLELESFFEKNGEEKNIDVGVISFKKNERIKASVVVPGIHPGPFGSLGGSDLPEKISRNFDYPVFVFHSASTHDENPVNSDEVAKIADAVKSCVDDAEYVSGGSRIVKKASKTAVFTQFFGNTSLIVHSPLFPTDDVDPETGKTAVLEADNAFFVDAHNNLEKGADSVVFGSSMSKEIIQLSKNAVSTAKENRIDNIRVGVSSKRIESDDVGKQGVQVIVVEANSQKTAYILWDGNNMLPDTKKKIEKDLEDIVDELIICTTDNHAVNLTMDGFNPVGSSVKNTGIISKEVVQQALNNLEDVKVGVYRKKIRMMVSGKGSTKKLTDTVNSTMSILKYAMPASLGGSVLACTFILYLF